MVAAASSALSPDGSRNLRDEKRCVFAKRPPSPFTFGLRGVHCPIISPLEPEAKLVIESSCMMGKVAVSTQFDAFVHFVKRTRGATEPKVLPVVLFFSP